jgi:uncharacterized membrane protein
MEALGVIVVIAVVLAILSAPIISIIALRRMKRVEDHLYDSEMKDTSFKLEVLAGLKKLQQALRADAPPAKPTPERTVASSPAPAAQERDTVTTTPSTAKAPPPLPKVVTPTTLAAQSVEQRYKKPLAALADSPRKAAVELRKPKELVAAVETAKEVLSKIWSWLLVGDEHRPKNMSMEYAVASTWLMRAGIVAIVSCVIFFMKWSIEHNLVTEWMRVGVGILAGLVMMIGAVPLIGKKYNVLAQGLFGGGVATLYASMYAAGMMYHLLPVPAVFGLMILVTVAAGLVAVRANSMLIAILGIIGGYCTPIALSTGVPQFLVLYSYVLLLGIGIFGIAHRKQWRLLNYLAFVFTYVLFFGSLKDYEHVHLPVVITFLSVFFVLFSWLVFYHNILRRNRTTALEIIQLSLNALIYSLTGYILITDAHPGPYASFMTLALAAFYIAHVCIFLKRRLSDRNLLLALVALAGLYASTSLPIIMEKESLTICLSLLGLTFVWLGYRMGSNFIRSMGQVIYVIVFYRLLCMDVPDNFSMKTMPAMAIADYWKAMVERLWTFGISIGSIAGAFCLHRSGDDSDEAGAVVSRDNDTRELLPRNAAKHVLYWFGILFLFLFLHLELNTMFGYYRPMRLPTLTVLWCMMALYFLWRYVASRRSEMLAAMWFFLVVGVGKVLFFDLASWKIHYGTGIFRTDYTSLLAQMRLLDFGAAILLLAIVWRVLRAKTANKQLASNVGYSGLAVLFVYLSLEANTAFHYLMPNFQEGAVTTLWSLFAIAFVAVGIWQSLRPLRYSGLAIFAVVAVKVFLFDLSDIEGIYRVAAFMFVGALLLLGSFAYLYWGGRFSTMLQTKDDAKTEPEDNQ